MFIIKIKKNGMTRIMLILIEILKIQNIPEAKKFFKFKDCIANNINSIGMISLYPRRYTDVNIIGENQ